jgi:ABC-type bacteriocin/lantibiotic exporter with double-glycine peptidase domain
MILEYYHNQNGHHKSLSPKEIMQGLGDRFKSSSGISADKLVEGLRDMELGYEIDWKAELDKEALISELREGPVIAQVHLHLGTSGYAHMVVVSGVSDDGNKVHLNDPWTGEHRELTWEAFEKTWTFPNYPESSQLIVRIRP